MAEAVGLALSAAAIIGFTEATTSLVCAIKEVYVNKDGSLLSEISDTLNRLETTSTAIEAATETLDNEVTKHPQSKAAKKLKRKKCLAGIHRQIGILTSRLETMAARIIKVTRAKELRWALTLRKKVDGLIPQTILIENLIVIAFSMIQVERLDSLSLTCDAELAKALKDIIREKRNEADRRNQELQRIQAYGLVHDEEDPYDYKQIRQLQRIKTEICALIDDAESTSSRQQVKRARPSLPKGTPSMPQPLPSPSSSSASARQPTSLVDVEGAISTKTTGESSLVSSASSATSDRSLTERWAALGKTSSLAAHEGDKVRPLELNKANKASDSFKPKEIILSPGTDRPILPGVLRSGDSLKNVKLASARADKTLSENIMSLSAAKDLELQVEEKADLGSVIFGDHGSMNLVGTAETYWWPPGDRSRERGKIKVLFWVCEYLKENIILGRPFFEAEARQKSRSGEP